MTTNVTKNINEADALLELLAWHCEDLESLLALAEDETKATASSDFEALIYITRERETLGERLTHFQQQVTASRQRLGTEADNILQTPTALRVTNLVKQIITQDEQTQTLLITLRNQQQEERKKLDQTQRGIAGYHNATRIPAVACDQLA